MAEKTVVLIDMLLFSRKGLVPPLNLLVSKTLLHTKMTEDPEKLFD